MKPIWCLVLGMIVFVSHVCGATTWKSVVLHSVEGAAMGGCAIGDLDATSPGNETAVVDDRGEVWMVKWSGNSWVPECIHKSPGEMIMCAIGDVSAASPGNEFVGAGMKEGEESSRGGGGMATLVYREGNEWKSRPIFQDTHLLHGVTIGDVSAKHPGNEVITCGFNHKVTLLCEENGEWISETIYVANNRQKVLTVGDVLPEHEGDEIIVVGTDGNATVLWEGNLGWCHEVIFYDLAGQSRVTIGDRGVLIGGDKGKITLATREEGRWYTETIGRDSRKIRGVVITDLDLEFPGTEAYTCGYSGRVMQFNCTDKGLWSFTTLHEEDKPLHHLLLGEFFPGNSTSELLTCGHGGRLIMVYPEK